MGSFLLSYARIVADLCGLNSVRTLPPQCQRCALARCCRQDTSSPRIWNAIFSHLARWAQYYQSLSLRDYETAAF